MSIETAELRARLLKLLEEDTEFRYAVAGLIGLGEILRRLDRHEEGLKRIWEEIAKLREDMVKGFERHDIELARLREDMIKGFERYDMELAKLREDFNRAIQLFEKRFEAIDKRFEAVDRRFEIIVNRLDRHEEEIKRLREDFRKMLMRIQRIERTLDHISISIEDEARDAVAWLFSKYGISIQITDIRIDERYEFDIYGSTDSFTIIGDAKVRASIKTLKRLLSRIEEARKIKPEIFRGRTIPVLYCLKFVGDPIEAEKMGIWLIKSDKELTKLKL
ncbi:conserved hypothetical protein [Ignisphaera aggregans DSM 17230]|uniref:DUF8196 domain-containing protein n=1 Tax=Ignisphaera aggregans (strain DSM 17230 / JCM 13409 / AQ1.S1) TaxID=583356 RepID=E0ST13_IGNAA|nr:conserved hypothetical protein [Ignisphaera aggregans DSM 17230]